MRTEQDKTEFKQIYQPIAITELKLMQKKIEVYEIALNRLARNGAGFGPAGKIAREALAVFIGEQGNE